MGQAGIWALGFNEEIVWMFSDDGTHLYQPPGDAGLIQLSEYSNNLRLWRGFMIRQGLIDVINVKSTWGEVLGRGLCGMTQLSENALLDTCKFGSGGTLLAWFLNRIIHIVKLMY